MEAALKIAAVCLLATVICALLKKTSPSMALVLSIAVCAAAVAVLLGALGEGAAFLRQVSAWGGLSSELFAPLVKTVAIALVSRIGGALCRDAGESAAASLVEMAGAFAAILVSLPLFSAAWELLEGLV